MKHFILTLVFTALSMTALAREGNGGPNASPVPTNPIAKVEMFAGFAHPDSASYMALEVLSNGRVIQTEQFRNGKPQNTRFIVQLDAEILRKLEAHVAATSLGPVIDPQPEFPGCTDAPTLKFSAIKADGTKNLLETTANCKVFEKENGNGSDRTVVEILKSLMTIASLGLE